MSRRPLRILVYVPVVWPDASRRRLVGQARGLADAAARHGGGLTLLAAPTDLAGQPIPWPSSVYRPLRVPPPAKFAANTLPAAPADAFDQFTELADSHDVLFLPQPFGALPSDSRLALPRPVVLGLDDLPFDRTDYGARSDRFRRELDRLLALAAGCVFPTELARLDLVNRYGVPPERAWVVPPVGAVIAADPAPLRRRYGLPERYVLAVGWQRDGGATAAAVGELTRGGVACVGVGEVGDEPPFAGLDEADATAAVRAKLAATGWHDLRAVDFDDVPGLVKGAAVLIAADGHAAGPDWYTLSALASGVPVVHPQAPAFAERVSGEQAWSFTNGDELAAAVRECLAHPAARTAAARAAFAPGPQTDDALYDALAGVVGSHRAGRPTADASPVPRDRRIAWLISHTTLRDAEVPLMRDLGYEVYTNKVLPKGEDYRSGSMDFSWDAGLTLPTDVLDHFNRFNFYQTPFDDEMAEALNAYFGTVIVAAYPPVIRELTKHFRGRILLRAFGREHPQTYGVLLNHHFEYGWRWERVWRHGHRFWLAACYEAIPPVEPPLLRDRTALLPVAMPDWSLRTRGQWTGTDRRVLFVCPSIKTSPGYYGVIYERFKTVYGDFPHVIGGSQPIPVDDPHVTGFLSDEQFQKVFRTARVMYYHSREPRHIHYHPLEAILYGMPVVYMRGGLMEAFDTGSQAGACYTDEEAREKLRRILDGDTELVRAIQESQISILDVFLPDGVREAWRRVFSGGVMGESCIPDVAGLPPEAHEQLPAGVSFDLRAVGESAVVRFDRPGLLAAATELVDEVLEGPSVLALPAPVDVVAVPPAEVPSPEPPPARRWSWKEAGKRVVPPVLHTAARPVYRFFRSIKWSVFGRPADAVVPVVTPAPYLAVSMEVGRPAPPPEPTPFERDLRYLSDPPSPPEPELLPAVGVAPLALCQLHRLFDRSGPAAVVDPVGTLDPNLPLGELRAERLVVGFSDLAWEYGDVYGPRTPAASREAMLWCRMAEHAVFGSEGDRRLAVRRYRLDPARTSVLPALTLTGGVDLTDVPPSTDVRGRWSLPTRYVIGYHAAAAEANSLAVYRAVRVLTRRGVKLNAVVLTGAIDGTAAGRHSPRLEAELQKAREECGLVAEQNLYVVPGVSERERAALERDAVLSLVSARSGGGAARDVARAALARVPVVACDSPALTGRGDPTAGHLLVVPADDPVALADAIEFALVAQDETRERTERAYHAARQANAAERVGEFERLAAAVTGRPTLRATG